MCAVFKMRHDAAVIANLRFSAIVIVKRHRNIENDTNFRSNTTDAIK